MTWEKGRQLKTFDDISYEYNANGIRTAKTVDGVRHEYDLEGSNILRESDALGNVIVPLYDGEEQVCGVTYNGELFFFHKNLQGDIIAITDQTATVVARYSYDTWGKCTILSDTSGCEIATVNPFRYRGYYYDDEIGMYYLQSRYYNPEVGRFVNSDVPEYAFLLLNAAGHNLITYCLNNPVNLIDTTGNIAIVDDLAVWALIGLCAVLLSLITRMMSTPQFQRSWAMFCSNIGNGLAWIGTSLINGGRAALKWTSKQVKAASVALSTYITIARADSKIRKKVKRNSKQRYWAASILKVSGNTYVEISSAISYAEAKRRVSCGLCVFTVSKSEARQLASNFPPVVGPEMGVKDAGQYMHYHVKGRKNKAHIFYLF